VSPHTGGASGACVGQDNRLNNITIDGSYFNNSFGLGGQPGDRTGVTPVSSAAIEEIQVSVAPYDVRQGNFVGAGVNMITRSGTNQFRGSAYYWTRDNDLVGTEAKGLTYNPGTFDSRRFGGWVSGPIIKDKLFFFGSVEDDKLTQPGTTFRANRRRTRRTSRVYRLTSTLSHSLQSLLRHRGYQTTARDPATPPGQPHNHDRNKLSVRHPADPKTTSWSRLLARLRQPRTARPPRPQNSKSW
jgi:outer membrane receptor for ferrienterochelin and colicin